MLIRDEKSISLPTIKSFSTKGSFFCVSFSSLFFPFTISPDGVMKGIKPLAWFGRESSLVSGWAWGESYLKNGVLAFEAPVGQGKLYAFGPEITFRAQAHNTFKLLFNALYLMGE